MRYKSKIQQELSARYQKLMVDTVNEIIKACRGVTIDLNEDGFEDEAGNDIYSVNGEYVFFYGGEYPLTQLGFWDAMRLLESIEKQSKEIFG